MHDRPPATRPFATLQLCLLAVVAVLSGCGGGGGGGTATPTIPVFPTTLPSSIITPTPTPSPVPTPSTGAVMLLPQQAAFDTTGSAAAQTVQVSQSGFTGNFTQTNTCTSIAAPSPVSNHNGTATFTITPEGAGSCAVTFTGGKTRTATLPVSVTVTQFTISNITSATQSLGVSIDGGAQQYVGLTTATNPNCTGSTTLTCTSVPLVVPSGSHSFVFNLYQEALVNGVPPANPTLVLSFPTGTLQITAGQRNSLGSFDASANSVTRIALSIAGLPAGSAIPIGGTGCYPATLTAYHGGNVISGPAAYINETGAAISFTLGSNLPAAFQPFVTFSPTCAAGSQTFSFSAPGQSVNVVTQGSVYPAFGIIASGNGLSSTLTYPAGTSPLTIQVTCAQSGDSCTNAPTPATASFAQLGDTATITFSETGWTTLGQGLTLTTDNCNTTDNPSSTGNWASFTPSLAGTATSFVVKAVSAGTAGGPAAICTATFADPLGDFAIVKIIVSTSSIVVQ